MKIVNKLKELYQYREMIFSLEKKICEHAIKVQF